MQFLLDSNILIPAEPTSSSDIELTTPLVTRMIGLISTAGFSAFIHPSSIGELKGDKNIERREMRLQLLQKYVLLPSPPSVPQDLHQKLGAPQPGTNNAIDNQLIAAVERNAVNYLISNDDRLHKKLARINLSKRGLYPSQAIALINGLIPSDPVPPPAVRLGVCHELNKEDSIFDSLRGDYPDFEGWLAKCQQKHRKVFIIEKSDAIAAIGIIKDESNENSDRVLKTCCFKVAENARGLKFGELLLKSIFDHCVANKFDRTYCSCFPKWTQLISMLLDFGFEIGPEKTRLGELILEKHFTPNSTTKDLNTLDFHIKFGPAQIARTTEMFVVPIEPRYHRMLFPDLEQQKSLFAGETAFGNSIRKAYLCHSNSKSLTPGAILLFYRSKDCRSIRAVGIVESFLRSSDATEIIEFVGKRTVYSKSSIEIMAESETLAILFRYAAVDLEIDYDDLISAGCLGGIPQSISRVKSEGVEWIQQQIGM